MVGRVSSVGCRKVMILAHVGLGGTPLHCWLWTVQFAFGEIGGGNRARTGDLRLMSPPLYQLSYPAF